MDAFSYLSVLISIILGLAITQVLQGFRGLLLSRHRVDLYWPVPVWAGLLLLMTVQSWWAMFGLRNVRTWTFALFAIVLLQTILTYMLTALVLPDFEGDEPVDLRAHYYGHVRWFFGMAIAIALVSLAKTLAFDGHLPEPADLLFHAWLIVTGAIAMATRRGWYHEGLAGLSLVIFCAYVGVLFTHLR